VHQPAAIERDLIEASTPASKHEKGWIARGKDVVKDRPQDKGGSTSSCRPGLESGSTLASHSQPLHQHLHQSFPSHRQPPHLSLCAHTLCSSRLPVHPRSSAIVQPASPSASAPTLLCTPTPFFLSFEQSQSGSIILPIPTPSLCALRRACTGASSYASDLQGAFCAPPSQPLRPPSRTHRSVTYVSDLSALAPTLRAALHQLPSSSEASASRTAVVVVFHTAHRSLCITLASYLPTRFGATEASPYVFSSNP